jgi:hypothetical protein
MATRQKLTVTRYILPGTYVGQVYRPKVVNVGLFPRIPCYIGKGLPYLTAENIPIVRSFVYKEKCNFPASAPYLSTLNYPSNGSQLVAYSQAPIRLYNTNGEEVPTRFWRFTKATPSGPYDTVEVFSEAYNPNDTYYIDYQSTSDSIMDALPISGVRQINMVGDQPHEALYQEHTDWESYTSTTGPVPDPANVGLVSVIKQNAASKYNGPDRKYYLTVEGNDLTSYPTFAVTKTSAGILTINEAAMTLSGGGSSYTGANPATYNMTVANYTVAGSTTSFDLNWSDGSTTGVVHVSTTTSAVTAQPLMNGIRVDIGNINGITNADTFSIAVAQTHRVRISWYSDDYQSASGIFDFLSNGDKLNQVMEAGVTLDFLNLPSFVVGDKFLLTANNTDTINWNFTRQISQDFTPSDIYYDAMGLVTGTPRTYYITLNNTPVEQVLPAETVTLVRIDTNATIPHTNIPGTPYVKLNIQTPLLVNFRASYHYHNAPHAGQQYYVTATYTRPESQFNEVSIYSSYGDALLERGYPSADNHLGVMLDYAFNVAACDFVACVQVFDADHDGVYNTADYRTALQATERNKEITDIVVLSKFDTLADQVYQSQVSNDPIVGALRLYWIGYPIGYAVGTPGTSGTISNTSQNVLQVSGSNAAHGTFISCANDWVKRTVTLQTGKALQLTLDGSFFAGMLCAINDAYRDPNTLLNNQVVPGIDDIRTYTDTQMEILGSSSNTFASLPKNSTVVKVIDAVTTDTSADDYHEINVMCVKQLVSKRVIRAGNAGVIGYVPRNVDDGVSFVRSVISRELTACVGEGLIADYSDANGRPRDLKPEQDVDVWRDEEKTRYNFTFWFNGRYGIKRLTGLYSVDENVFKTNA